MGTSTFILGGDFVSDQNSEVERAISALTAEILNLSSLEGETKAALSVTIENAFARLVLAIEGKSKQTLEQCLEEAAPTVP
jgi:hypothetical protein